MEDLYCYGEEQTTEASEHGRGRCRAIFLVSGALDKAGDGKPKTAGVIQISMHGDTEREKVGSRTRHQ